MKDFFSIKTTLLTFLFLSLSLNVTRAQNEVEKDTTKRKRGRFLPIPLVYATPETSWGFGAGANYTFKFKNESDESLSSSMQLLASYTLNKQVLIFYAYQLFLKEEKYKIYGELGYYRYNYFFYGVGNDDPIPDGELYDVNYPRVQINALYLVKPQLYLGLRYWLDDWDVRNVDPNHLLATNIDITGREGGLLSGLGFVMNYDTRDNLFYPSEGVYVESSLFSNRKFLGSDFNFNKLYLDASKFWTTSWDHIIGINLYSELTVGDPPFNQMSLMGNRRRMRGYYEGRYRDNHYITFQGEYRFPVFWRLGLVAFGGVGAVANEFSEFGNDIWRYTVGGGLRLMFDKKEKINIRVDMGFGKDTSAFYLSIGEAF